MNNSAVLVIIMCALCALFVLLIILIDILMSINDKLGEIKRWIDDPYKSYRNALFNALMRGNFHW